MRNYQRGATGWLPRRVGGGLPPAVASQLPWHECRSCRDLISPWYSMCDVCWFEFKASFVTGKRALLG